MHKPGSPDTAAGPLGTKGAKSLPAENPSLQEGGCCHVEVKTGHDSWVSVEVRFSVSSLDFSEMV